MKWLRLKTLLSWVLALACLISLARLGFTGGRSETPTPDGRLAKQKWPTQIFPLRWKLNGRGVPNSKVTLQQAREAVTEAFALWQDIKTASVSFVFADTTSIATPEPDGEYIISFVPGSEEFGPGVAGVAIVFSLIQDVTFTEPPDFDGDGDPDFITGTFPAGTIIDANIILNTKDFEFTIDLNNQRPGAVVDIEDVVAHEIGHTIGLSHVILTSAIMYPAGFPPFRVLGADDIAECSDTYPSALYPTTFGSISGSVRSGINGQSVAGAFVTAINEVTGEEIGAISGQVRAKDFDGNGTISPSEIIVLDGDYRIPGLVPGVYRLILSPINGNPILPDQINKTAIYGTTATPPDYPEEFLDAVESNTDFARDFKLITVTAGKVSSGNDFITNQIGVPQVGQPIVIAVAPDSVARGGSVQASISGKNFENGAMVKFSGSGIAVNNVTLVGSDQLNATITVAITASLGIRNVTVTNPTGQSGTGIGLLKVVAGVSAARQDTLRVENTAANAGDKGVVVPISLSNVSEVGGINLKIKYARKVLTPTGVRRTARTANFEHFNFSLSDSVLSFLAIADFPGGSVTPPLSRGKEPIAEILFDVSQTAPAGETTLHLVTGQLSEPRGTRVVLPEMVDGKITIAVKKLSITGLVSYFQSLLPVPRVKMILSGDRADTAQTDNIGSYQLKDIFSGSTLKVTPTKTGDKNPLTITCFDAALIAQHAVGNITLTPDQQKAADVDENGQILFFDAALACRHAVGLAPFNQNDHAGDWRFQPPSRSYSSLASDQTGQGFTAYVLGDADGNWRPASQVSTGVKAQEYAHVSFVEPAWSTDGKEVSIKLQFDGEREAYSFDLALIYDAHRLRFKKSTCALESWQFAENSTEAGRLRLGMYATTALAKAEKIVQITWEILMLEESTKLTLEHALVNQERQAKTEFVLHGQSSIPESFALHPNYPNPFNPETTIRFDIPKVAEGGVHVRIAIYNLLGQPIKVLLDEKRSPGRYAVNWDGRNEFGSQVPSGVYTYKIAAGDFKATKKMLFLK